MHDLRSDSTAPIPNAWCNADAVATYAEALSHANHRADANWNRPANPDPDPNANNPPIARDADAISNAVHNPYPAVRVPTAGHNAHPQRETLSDSDLGTNLHSHADAHADPNARTNSDRRADANADPNRHTRADSVRLSVSGADEAADSRRDSFRRGLICNLRQPAPECERPAYLRERRHRLCIDSKQPTGMLVT